jgi:hypothetical protein
MQTKLWSLIESFSNVIIGYLVALLSQIIVFPFFDIHVSLKTNIAIGAWFTVISIARSYCIRRLYNWIAVRGIRRYNNDVNA